MNDMELTLESLYKIWNVAVIEDDGSEYDLGRIKALEAAYNIALSISQGFKP